ncbi:MAG: TetR/AcrR family transcriptional regulator [Desulforhabdus sp.]|nr:TetR/AcrR family transcriptional regulator [Desulforhabdus sp.]
MNRKESILDAATQLFAEKGFEATPTAEVAKIAGVSEGTIFHHFKTKNGVFIHIISRVMNLYYQKVRAEAENAGSGLEAIEQMIRLHFHFINEHSMEFLVIFRDLPAHLLKPDLPHRKVIQDQVEKIFALLAAAIDRGQSDGSIRTVPTRQTAFILRGLLIGLTRQRLQSLLQVPDLSEEAVEFCHRSLAASASITSQDI